jgi:hypothetical protein
MVSLRRVNLQYIFCAIAHIVLSHRCADSHCRRLRHDAHVGRHNEPSIGKAHPRLLLPLDLPTPDLANKCRAIRQVGCQRQVQTVCRYDSSLTGALQANRCACRAEGLVFIVAIKIFGNASAQGARDSASYLWQLAALPAINSMHRWCRCQTSSFQPCTHRFLQGCSSDSPWPKDHRGYFSVPARCRIRTQSSPRDWVMSFNLFVQNRPGIFCHGPQ